VQDKGAVDAGFGLGRVGCLHERGKRVWLARAQDLLGELSCVSDGSIVVKESVLVNGLCTIYVFICSNYSHSVLALAHALVWRWVCSL
jgi:hypothetical protein